MVGRAVGGTTHGAPTVALHATRAAVMDPKQQPAVPPGRPSHPTPPHAPQLARQHTAPSSRPRSHHGSPGLGDGARVGAFVVGAPDGDGVGDALGRAVVGVLEVGAGLGELDGAMLGAWVASHRLGVVSRQSPLVQSLSPFLHCLPPRHFGHIPPPQSTDVSSPFLRSSLHVAFVGPNVGLGVEGLGLGAAVGASVAAHRQGSGLARASAHVLSGAVGLHTPLTQSRGPSRHFRPSVHSTQIPPPQSTAVSSWLSSSSTQLAGMGDRVGERLG